MLKHNLHLIFALAMVSLFFCLFVCLDDWIIKKNCTSCTCNVTAIASAAFALPAHRGKPWGSDGWGLQGCIMCYCGCVGDDRCHGGNVETRCFTSILKKQFINGIIIQSIMVILIIYHMPNYISLILVAPLCCGKGTLNNTKEFCPLTFVVVHRRRLDDLASNIYYHKVATDSKHHT